MKASKQASRRVKPLSSGEKSPAAPGLRERKQQQTRERLKRAAMALFLERGFETTTIDDIAAAADVSRRSFFHYFASKEDVVAAWQEDAAAALVSEILARPADESMLTAAENAIAAAVKRIDPTEAAAMSRLKRDNPALHARDQLKYEKLERALADGLTQRSGRKSDRLKARLVAMIATGAMRVGGESWIGEGAREKPEAFVKRTFDAIRAILK
ncbi:TetR/AcrR family transcriptional regulator [Bradyrhizobium diazoefficiens]|nr:MULTISPECIES: TetR/AcrR family transcriptional regulator [Bradyrhizobium]APO49877.1 transcriptional regulator [Bradyrhizobium diazoefficiens]KOY07376.1 transcriptional regulator [Bradyrhizobium diazoefficiens]MCD9295804.1 TetR/AcrR family transcriptional regulator [Bradyrhizobium diazoefficiens]MCD9810313.1 TetR/AcrR family transcriptional regulator [Bradyrhizobium diazoefficiens]MCD9828213.1 TetR/AcrR family transcriptional regulator [Bradyrhizobium diazoefficiens]